MDLVEFVGQLGQQLVRYWFVSGLVVAVFAYFVYQITTINARLSQERATLRERLKTLRGRLDELGKTGQRAEQAEVREWIERWGSAPGGGLSGEIVRRLGLMRWLQNPDTQSVVRLSQDSPAAGLVPLRGYPNLLFILGLFGTVFGLALSVGTLADPLAASLNRPNPQLLTQKLSLTLGEMQGAFAFTLLGIVLSVLAAQLLAWAHRSLVEVQVLAQELVVEFAGYSFPSSQAAQLEDLRAMLSESRDFIQGVAELMNRASGEFKEVLERAGERIDQSLDRLAGVSEAITQSLAEVTDEAKEVSQSIAAGARHIDQGLTELRTHQEEIQSVYTDLQTKFDQSLEGLKVSSQEQMNEFTQVAERIVNDSASHTRQVVLVQQLLERATTAFEDSGGKYERSSLGLLNQLNGGFQGITSSLQGMLERHAGEMGAVHRGVEKVAANLSDLSSRLDPRLLPREDWARVADELSAARGDLAKLVGALPQITDRSLSPDLAEALIGILGSLKRMERSARETGPAAGGAQRPTGEFR
ncbi:MAG: hypothetical protein SFU83_07975 [Meiothermus sp.]|nr:hypothetical protein [Meiothermus sp.]